MNISKENNQDPTEIKYVITELLNKKYPQLFDQDSSSPETPPIIQPESKIDTENIEIGDSFDEIDPDNENSSIVHNIDHGAFELNFSEFPMAHLTQRLPKGIDKHTIKYSDLIRGKNGELKHRNWTIRTSAEHGLGGPTSIDVLFEIMQVWKEQGFEKDRIFIGTYYNLLKRLGWDTSGKSYDQLEKDLRSIYGLDIEAENAYYDKEQGEYVNKSVKPFIGWQFNKKNEYSDFTNDYGYIQVNQEFFKDFKKKSLYYLPFDNEFFKSLTAHEQKLSLYLTKIFNPYRKKIQNTYSRKIQDLCNLLPLYGTKSKQKYYLVQACKGLISKNFILLERFIIDDEIITFFNRQQQSLLPFLNIKSNFKSNKQVELLLEDQIKLCGDSHSINFYTLVAKFVPDEIIFECISEAKQEGKDKKKLYTKIIIERAYKYLEPYLKTRKSNADKITSEAGANNEFYLTEADKQELQKYVLDSY
jgi:hypothetical protein